MVPPFPPEPKRKQKLGPIIGPLHREGALFFCPRADLPSFFLLVNFSSSKRKGKSALHLEGKSALVFWRASLYFTVTIQYSYQSHHFHRHTQIPSHHYSPLPLLPLVSPSPPCCPLSLLPPPATDPTTLTPRREGLASIAITTVAMSRGSGIATMAGGMDTGPCAAPSPPLLCLRLGGRAVTTAAAAAAVVVVLLSSRGINGTLIRRLLSVASGRRSRRRRRRRRHSRRAGSSSRRSPVRRVLDPSPPVLLP